MPKSTKYIIAILVLLGMNLWLFLSSDESSVQASEKYFNSEDLAGVSAFNFQYEGDEVTISRTGDGWIINDSYLADQGFINTLISILERVEIRSTIGDWDAQISGSVEVEFDFNSRYRFDFAANANKTRSYFISDGKAKEVIVPGYRDNVIDIFTLHSDQWRDRLIVDGSWRTIQKIAVSSEMGNNFEISFADKFFLVNGQSPNDSSSVVGYLNQFQQFQANEMISEGRFPEMDSIGTTQPFAMVTIDDIKYDQPIQLEFYKNKANQPYHLVKDQNGQQMVIDVRRVQQILSNPDQVN